MYKICPFGRRQRKVFLQGHTWLDKQHRKKKVLHKDHTWLDEGCVGISSLDKN